jgi:hypothetical protein
MDFNKIVGRAAWFISESNLFISISAAAFCASTYCYLGFDINPIIIAFVFFATLFTYTFQRLVVAPIQFGSFRTIQFIIIGAALFTLGILVWWLTPLALILFGFAGFLSIGYAVPCIPIRSQLFSLRQLPHFKLPVIVLAWLIAAVVVPFSEIDNGLNSSGYLTMLLHTLQQGGVVAVIAICFDIRDLPDDAVSQRTLPQRFGMAGSIKIGSGILWISAAASAVNFLFGNLTIASFGIALMLLPLLWLVLKNSRPNRSPYYFGLLADGILLLPAIGFLLLRLLQI